MAKAMEKKPVRIPYLDDGSIPTRGYYDGRYWDYASQSYVPVTMKWDDPFNAVIQLQEMDRNSNGTVWFVWKNVMTGATYCTSFTHMKWLLGNAEWNGPLLIDGLWQPVKRGYSYFIEYVPTEKA